MQYLVPHSFDVYDVIIFSAEDVFRSAQSGSRLGFVWKERNSNYVIISSSDFVPLNRNNSATRQKLGSGILLIWSGSEELQFLHSKLILFLT